MDILGKGILFLSVAKFVCKSEEKKKKKLENCTGQFVERFLPQP